VSAATLNDYLELIEDRPRKFTPAEVGYVEAPEGSAITCNGCLHYYRRGIDGHSTCEIMRDERTDREGVRPDWRCRFQTVDGSSWPLVDAPTDQQD
jgi:hypothetical protein